MRGNDELKLRLDVELLGHRKIAAVIIPILAVIVSKTCSEGFHICSTESLCFFEADRSTGQLLYLIVGSFLSDLFSLFSVIPNFFSFSVILNTPSKKNFLSFLHCVTIHKLQKLSFVTTTDTSFSDTQSSKNVY